MCFISGQFDDSKLGIQMAKSLRPSGRSDAPEGERNSRDASLLEAATDLFYRRGYSATSIQEVADAVGITKASIYYYIESKEELLYRIVQQIHGPLHMNLARLEASSLSTGDRLESFIATHIRVCGSNVQAGRVFFTDFRQLQGEPRHRIAEERMAYDRWFRKLFKEAQAEGIICPDVDPDIAVPSTLSHLNSVCLWYRPDDLIPLDALTESYTTYVMRGLSCTSNCSSHRSP